jgi:hypothetical protein
MPLIFDNTITIIAMPKMEQPVNIPMARSVIHLSKTWLRAGANEFGCLAQGVGNQIEGSNTIQFTPRSAVPQRKTVTYQLFVVDIRPNKPEVNRVCPTVGCNLIHYHVGIATRAADLTTSKCLWSSTISTDGAT